MSIFQIIASLFALFMLYIVNIHQKKKTLSSFEVLFWYGLWILFIFISIFPESVLSIAQDLHFARVFDFLTVAAFMVLTVVVVMNYFQQKENTKKIEEYIRKIALKKHE